MTQGHDRHGPHLTPETRAEGLNRLARIEGQVRGLQRMIEDDRYCVEILNQIDAARGALRQVSQLILRNYLANCVSRAITEGDPNILNELASVVQRLDRE